MDNIQKKQVKKAMTTYNIYCSWVDNVSINGEPLMPFDNLPPNIKKAWIMASNNIFKEDLINNN